MTNKKDRIIELYNQTKLVHPSLQDIATKVGVVKSYVWQIINEYNKIKEKEQL